MRLVVCCDGTWENALKEQKPELTTNVTHIVEALSQVDLRGGSTSIGKVPIYQEKLYLPGVGTSTSKTKNLVDGMLGTGMISAVRTAYYWLALNYQVGDEGYLGIFPLAKIPNFAEVFKAINSRQGPPEKDPDGVKALNDAIAPYMAMKQAQDAALDSPFIIKVVAVFDTLEHLLAFDDAYLNSLTSTKRTKPFGGMAPHVLVFYSE
ncbi:hypothetical protein MNV49_004630 [Pseudohyphozyma bogoriensis]|nr:hypothetical protein MNV49_004630 [Pseudohyphozyma bogoriensis]